MKATKRARVLVRPFLAAYTLAHESRVTTYPLARLFTLASKTLKSSGAAERRTHRNSFPIVTLLQCPISSSCSGTTSAPPPLYSARASEPFRFAIRTVPFFQESPQREPIFVHCVFWEIRVRQEEQAKSSVTQVVLHLRVLYRSLFHAFWRHSNKRSEVYLTVFIPSDG